jgi:hypothetical protein
MRRTIYGASRAKELSREAHLIENTRRVREDLGLSTQWWIRYADATGRIRREKAGTKASAHALYHKRKAQVLAGHKLPEKLRQRPVLFSEIAEDALTYSRARKRSYRTDVSEFRRVNDWFGLRVAEELTQKEIDDVVSRAAEKDRWSSSTFNHYRTLISLAYRLAICNGKAAVNPTRSVSHRREDNSRVRFLTDEEEDQLRKIMRARYSAHLPELDVALNPGLRQGS